MNIQRESNFNAPLPPVSNFALENIEENEQG